MQQSNVCQHTNTAQSSKITDTNVTLPVTIIDVIETIVVDEQNTPLPNATLVVLEDSTNFSSTNFDGKGYLAAVLPNHTVQINYAGAVQTFNAAELPTQVKFTDELLTHQLDTVHINGKKKSNFWYNLTIAAAITGVMFTVITAIKEEKQEPLKVSL